MTRLKIQVCHRKYNQNNLSKVVKFTGKMHDELKRMKNQFSDFCDFQFLRYGRSKFLESSDFFPSQKMRNVIIVPSVLRKAPPIMPSGASLRWPIKGKAYLYLAKMLHKNHIRGNLFLFTFKAKFQLTSSF